MALLPIITPPTLNPMTILMTNVTDGSFSCSFPLCTAVTKFYQRLILHQLQLHTPARVHQFPPYNLNLFPLLRVLRFYLCFLYELLINILADIWICGFYITEASIFAHTSDSCLSNQTRLVVDTTEDCLAAVCVLFCHIGLKLSLILDSVAELIIHL